jgi:hypothetical protein
MGSNFRKHELIGLLMVFMGGTLLGFGLYLIMWGANRPLFYGSLQFLMSGREYLVFPVFFGVGLVLLALGQIELKEAVPGKGRR